MKLPSSTPHQSAGARRPSSRIALVTLALLGAVIAPTAVDVSDRAGAAELSFPFTTTFDDRGGGTLFGDAAVSEGWLTLTSATRNQAGSWSSDGVFPSSLGLEIEFRYAMYGGDRGADGILLALSDGAAPQGVGQYGASLGYVCADSSLDFGACDKPGLPGGYLGIAFDRYGNFSRSLNGTGTGQAPDTVGLRGAGDGVTGYRFLQNAPVPGGVATSNRANAAVVRITLLPNDSGHTTLTVRTTTPTHKDLQTVIDRVPIEGAGQGPLPETLRLGLAASTGSFTNRHEVAQLSVWVPTDLRSEHEMPTAVAGTNYAYDVRMTNDGPNDAVGAETQIDVPELLGSDATWTCASEGAGASCGSGSGSVDNGVIRSTADLKAGSSVVYTVQGQLAPDAAGALDSRAEIVPPASRADLNENNNVSRATAAVTADAQLGTDKSVALVGDKTELHPGDDVEYTVAVTNRGPSVAMDVGADDPLPEQLAFAGSDDDCTADGRRVTCRSTGPLAVDAARTFRFRATLDPAYAGDGSDVVNIAVGTSPTDPGGGDPSDPVVLPPIGGGEGPKEEPEPSESASAAPTPAPAGEPTPKAASGQRGSGGDSGQRDRALAFTGAEGLVPVAVVGAMALMIGIAVMGRRVLRHRRAGHRAR
jgi:uncharacterized repeat protein (TIGR01451 family)